MVLYTIINLVWGMFLQFRLSEKNLEEMLKNGEFDIKQKSENLIDAKKDQNYGKIHLQMKRETSNYMLKECFYWVVNIHFEIGLRPKRFFDSPEVKNFAEKYIIPYATKTLC